MDGWMNGEIGDEISHIETTDVNVISTVGGPAERTSIIVDNYSAVRLVNCPTYKLCEVLVLHLNLHFLIVPPQRQGFKFSSIEKPNCNTAHLLKIVFH